MADKFELAPRQIAAGVALVTRIGLGLTFMVTLADAVQKVSGFVAVTD